VTSDLVKSAEWKPFSFADSEQRASTSWGDEFGKESDDEQIARGDSLGVCLAA